MQIFNSIINAIFDGFFAIMGMLGGDLAFWIFSALSGVFFLLIFKWTSNQKAIRGAKDRIAAGFLEVRLFKDDPGQMMRSQGTIFGSTFRYMLNAFRPMLFMIVPVLLMLIQLNLWYGYQPLTPDTTDVAFRDLYDREQMSHDISLDASTSAIVRARFEGDFSTIATEVQMTVDDGLELVTPPLRIPTLGEINWRIRAVREGDHAVRLKIGERELTKTVHVGNAGAFRKIEPMLVRGAWEELWNPGAPPLPADVPLTELSITYPAKQFSLFGWHTDWVIAYFIISLVFGFAFKGVFGVEI